MMEKRERKENRIWAVVLAFLLMFMLPACGMAGMGNIDPKQQESASDTAGDEEALKTTSVTETTSASDTSSTVITDSQDTTLTITAIKGGAADTFVLISDNHVTIIDTGLDKKADRLVDFLKEQGVTRVDELIITHFDKDHVGGADHVINNFEVGTVYTTYHSKESDDITAYLEALHANDLTETTVRDIVFYEADGVSFTIYPPRAEAYAEKISNNSSLVIMVSLGENSMLFAGDAEGERIAELLNTDGLQATILKVPHHGRLAYNSEDLIKYVAPKYAIITSSKNEPEDQQVLDYLEENGVVTYLTRDGNITITMTSTNVSISQ